MKKHIPNLITLMNVISGALAVFMVMYGKVETSVLLILLAMVFDFFDGLAARVLHVKSEMGKELDSLADMVSFGLAPAMLAHFLIKQALPEAPACGLSGLSVGSLLILFLPLVIPAFSAYRLAKFNLDARQTLSFIGMPTPANALFWCGLVFGYYHAPVLYASLFAHTWVLAACVLIFSILLICELPMFSLKITGFSWKTNRVRYTYLLALIVLLLFFGKAALLFVIPLYLLFSVADALLKIILASSH